jgi:hypothetical protein
MTPIKKETTEVKHSKTAVRGKARTALELRFEDQHLTSYSGLVLFQHYFSLIGLKERLGKTRVREQYPLILEKIAL